MLPWQPEWPTDSSIMPGMTGTRATPARVSQMKPAQAAAVAKLVRKVVSPLEYYSKAAREQEMAKYTPAKLRVLAAEDPDSVLVASKGDRLVGFCFSRFDDGLIWLAWFGVDHDARGQGVGRALLTALEGTIRLRGAHKLWCDCRVNNSQSKAVLVNAGFTPIANVRNHWYGHDFILWEKAV